MTIEAPALITMALGAVAGLVWLIRLEGRINLNERLYSELSEDVKYIRERIDQALNGQTTLRKRASD